jgi:branched-chain amino acid transport system substrate-binding protein
MQTRTELTKRGMAKGPFRLAGISLATILAATVVAGCGSSQSSSSGATSTSAQASSSTTTGGGGGSGAVTDLSSYTKGGSGAANNSLSPVTLGWVNQQGGPLGFPNSTAGAEAAVKYVNSYLGGIGGHPLQLNTCFVVGSEQEGNTCGDQLVNNTSVKAVLYGTLIAGDQSFQAVDNGTKPIFMANSISPNDATGKNVFIFNGNPTSFFGGMAAYARTLKVKTVSAIYPQDSQSIAGIASMKAALNSVGIQLKSVGFDPSTTNLLAAATAAGVQSADMVVPLVSIPPNCVSAAQALDTLSVKAPVVSLGSFCFIAPVAAGLGGSAPIWTQIASQTNVLATAEPDVKSYMTASSTVGLTPVEQSDSNSALAWSLVLTAVRFLNEKGGAAATPSALASAAKVFTGPMLLGSPQLKCGEFRTMPGLCGFEMRAFKHTGGQSFTAVSGWLQPIIPK